METSIVTAKGRIIVPAKLRRKFDIKKGTRVVFREEEGKLILQPLDRSYFGGLSGILGSKGKVLKALMAERKREREE